MSGTVVLSFAAWIAAGLLGFSQAQAAEYYVSPRGSDNGPGTLAQPFQTIQKAASLMVAGDTTFIRAGTYRETVTPAHSGTQNAPITFMPYNGESVTVSGADVIPASAWTLSSGNIYTAVVSWVPDPNLNQVFVDGQMMIEARWPNTSLDVSHPTVAQTSGGSFIDGGSGLSTGTITDPNLPVRPAGYWNGAVLHAALGTAWVWQTGSVVSSMSNPAQLTFTFTKEFDTETPGPDNPYYLTGKLGELDTAGEFFLQAPSTLYLWTPTSDSPAQHVVEVKHRQQAFNITNLSFITIQGLNIFGSTIWVNNGSYVVLDSLNVKYVSHYSMLPTGKTVFDLGGNNGILLIGDHIVLRNSTIAFSSGAGVGLSPASASLVFNNTIHDVDYTPDYSAPIEMGATGSVFAYNTVYNSARSGIDWYSPTPGRILHNEIYDVGLQTNDLGCTYTYGTDGGGTEIAYNLCHDVHGLLLNNTIPYTNGIYLDNNTSNYVAHHNVVWNTLDSGALNSVSTSNKSYNNTFAGTLAGLTVYSLSGPVEMPGTEIENNIFTAPLPATPGAVLQNNILSSTDPQFIDPANNNYQLQPTSPAIGAGLIIPPYTNGFSGSAPDIGAYDHTKPAWKAGIQATAIVAAPSYAPTLTPGTVAVITGSVPFDSGVSVLLTDGAGVDLPTPLVYVVGSPPQLAFQVPPAAAPGVAMITITNGAGTISLSSAPLFAGAPPITIAASQGSGQSATIDTPFATALEATVKDASGNPVSGAAVTFAVPGTEEGGTFGPLATFTTNAAGVATASGFTANAVAGSYTVTASASGVGALATFNLTNRVGAPATVTATQGSGQSAVINTVFATTLQATVKDSGGNPVPGVTVTFAGPGSGASGSFAGPAAVQTNASGVATAPAFTANSTTGSYSVTASVAGVGAASFTLTNTGAASLSPIISGVVSGASFLPTFAASSWITIQGSNLSSTSRSWTAADFVGNNLPTQLDGVSVTVNGIPAYVYYISPAQLNVLSPNNSAVGPASVQVTNNLVTSAAFTVTEAAFAPAFFLFTSKYPAAVHLSGVDVGPTGLISGANFSPATGGETIELFGTGFGPTNPPSPAGTILVAPVPLANTVTVTIGGVPAQVVFAGLASNGLVQLNVTVPAGLPNGDAPIVATVNNTTTQSNLFLTIQN